MIFVTVGTQGQFNRLIRTVDEWAGLRKGIDVFAQTGVSDYRANNIRTKPFIDPFEFRECVASASIVIAHAGMGSIITALEYGKPILVMPRIAELGEHRNNHQIGTAKRFAEQGRILVAFDEQTLVKTLDQSSIYQQAGRISSLASPRLVSMIRSFIETRARNKNLFL